MALLFFSAYANTMAKPTSGIKNGVMKLPVESAMRPISRNPQPPTGVIMSIYEALLVRLPRPLSVSEKMVGNMIASNR